MGEMGCAIRRGIRDGRRMSIGGWREIGIDADRDLRITRPIGESMDVHLPILMTASSGSDDVHLPIPLMWIFWVG